MKTTRLHHMYTRPYASDDSVYYNYFDLVVCGDRLPGDYRMLHESNECYVFSSVEVKL